MKQQRVSNHFVRQIPLSFYQSLSWRFFLAGLIFPLGYSPFNFSGLTILSLAIFYALLLKLSVKKAFVNSFIYGMAIFSFGVSWVIISIHDYGSINYFLSAFITLLFIAYLSLYVGFVGFFFKSLTNEKQHPLFCALLFSALWTLAEFARATVMTGFPWLLAGTSQSNSPLKFLAPVIGSYGLGFVVCIAAVLLVYSMRNTGFKRCFYLISFIGIVLLPGSLASIQWTHLSNKPVNAALIQSNLSMRDKWNEALFLQILDHYQSKTEHYLKKDLIVMPESAIPLPSSYVGEFLTILHSKAVTSQTAILLGIPQPTDSDETDYYNSILGLGTAKGHYSKRHLVPFGEYIPAVLKPFNRWLQLPSPGLSPGLIKQPLMSVNHLPVASLICYEIAYPALLRQQMPQAQWIVSISDNGWFGHSLASYQQLQMAQMLSLQTGRYQALANNDGLSSVINAKGDVIDHLPPFSSGVLESALYGASGSTPWIIWGDKPTVFLCLFIILPGILLKIKRKPSH